MSEPILTIGTKSFMPDAAEEYNFRKVSILHDRHFDSCKLKITDERFNKVIPVQGGVSPDQLVIVTDTLASILEEFGHKELARNILGAYSRFMISKAVVIRG